MTVHRARWSRAVGLLLAAGCAGSAERRERALLLSDRRPPHAQRCVVDSLPATLPALAALGDSALLSTLVAEFRELAGRGRDDALLSLRFDARGRLVRSRVIESSLPDTLAARFALVVASALDEARAGALAVRLAVRLDTVPQFRIGRQQLCAPARRGAAVAEASTAAADSGWTSASGEAMPSPAWVLQGTAVPPTTAGRAGGVLALSGGEALEEPPELSAEPVFRARESRPTMVVRLLIDREGTVRGLEPVAGPLDAEALERVSRWAFRQQYYPALEDGFPVDGAVTVRIR